MENVAGEQGLAIQQHSYTTLLILFQFQTVKIISFFNGGGPHTQTKVTAPNFIKSRSCDGLAAKGLFTMFSARPSSTYDLLAQKSFSLAPKTFIPKHLSLIVLQWVSLSFCAGGQWGFTARYFCFSYERK